MSYNVTTDFGADNLDNTGATDNVARLNNILGHASTPALTAPFTLYFPAGTYKLSSQPSTVQAHVCFVGDGKDQTILNGVRGSVQSNAVLQVGSNVTLRDLQLTTTDDGNAVNRCLETTSATGITLTRVAFSNAFATGIRTGSASQVFASQCDWSNIYQDPSASGISGAFQNSSFVGCRFHDMNGALTTNHCVYLNGTTPNLPRNVTFTGCVFQSWGGPAVEIHGDLNADIESQGFSFSGCTFSGNQSQVAVFGQRVGGLAVTGCSFYSCNGIGLLTCLNFALTGNTHFIDDYHGFTFAVVQNCEEGIIVGNVVSSPRGSAFAGTGVAVYDSTNILINNNAVTGLMLGVALYSTSPGSCSGITIRNNKFTKPAGWAIVAGGTNYFFGNPSTFYGVVLNGAAIKTSIVDNECPGLNYELYFTLQAPYTGNADLVSFRSASWIAPSMSLFGFQGGAVPTHFTQLTTSVAALSPGSTGSAYSAVGH